MNAAPVTSAPSPQLAPPGAGLPPIERFFARLMVRWQARWTTRETATAAFSAERDAILRLVESTPPAALAARVLIKRLPGLEDSSRYWSVLMAVDHLRIVNGQVAGVLASLAAGRVPAVPASTAAVKPREDVDAAAVAEFQNGCRDFARTVAGVANLRTSVKFAHPWFGPMDAAAWHFMAGFHMRLHRKQMERILAGWNERAGGAGR